MPATCTCIIVDDDDIDRLTTLSFVQQHPLFRVTGQYNSAESALQDLNHHLPDVAFLDIDLPGISGLELRRQLDKIPACIFITSFSDYAVESFELEALDFIVKPIRAERFTKTVERITRYFEVKEKADSFGHNISPGSIFIKEGVEQVKLSLSEILYLEAFGDFTQVVTTGRKYCVLSNLGALIKQPGFSTFVRIHKSYAVEPARIEKTRSLEVIVNNISLPVGRAYRDTLRQLK
ncbi:MAG: response regulator transcription factor [Chitinophagaceae bacterium]|nr:MAG: response regulator transcription factor [Chitinophagaceae bacterium]